MYNMSFVQLTSSTTRLGLVSEGVKDINKYASETELHALHLLQQLTQASHHRNGSKGCYQVKGKVSIEHCVCRS